MKSKENNEKKGLRRLSDEELKEVTGGIHIYLKELCSKVCYHPYQLDHDKCECVN